MAARKTKGQTQTNEKEKPKIVHCCDCANFIRDTSGISHNVLTGEYFMGVCAMGLTPDSPKKQFADKPRICSSFIIQLLTQNTLKNE